MINMYRILTVEDVDTLFQKWGSGFKNASDTCLIFASPSIMCSRSSWSKCVSGFATKGYEIAYNFSFNPVAEYLSFVDKSEVSLDSMQCFDCSQRIAGYRGRKLYNLLVIDEVTTGFSLIASGIL